jgi:hypothetical protein
MSRLSRKLLLLGPHWSGGDSVALTFLLDVVFADYDDAAGPLSSPLTGRVGELTLAQNDGQFSIASGELVVPAQGTPAAGDLIAYDNTDHGRAAGIGMYSQHHFEDLAGYITYGILDGIPTSLTGQFNANFYNANGGERWYFKTTTNKIVMPTMSTSVDYEWALLLRNKGAFVLARGGVFGSDWTLQWIDNLSDELGVYSGLHGWTTLVNIDMWRVADLVANGYGVFGTRDLDLCTPGTGTGTSKIAAPNAGDTGVMTPDALVTFDVSAPSGDTTVFVRYVDATNYDQINIDASGNLTYDEIVSGVLNNLITANGVISGGETISATLNGGTVSLHYDDTLAGTTSSATNNTTGTGFELEAEADAVTNLATRTLDGVANVSSANHPGYGLATDVLPGPRAAADTFTHEADCVIIFALPAIPSSGTLEFWFRAATVGTDGWRVTIDSSGDVDLDEVVSGSPTQRGTSAAAVSGGERLVVICNDEEINVYADTSLLITYSSAVTQKIQTAGEIESLGTGGQISNVVTYPLSFASAPNTSGAADATAALAALGA